MSRHIHVVADSKMSAAHLTNMKRVNNVNFTKMIDANQICDKTDRSSKMLSLANSASVCLLNVLDILLLIVITPYMFWQCASGNDRVKIIARAVLEVALELLMWMIFAGVSILMTAAFLLENSYTGKNNSDSVQSIDAKFENPRSSRTTDSPDFFTGPEEPRNTD
ncbi:uncharacterized protein LOC144471963 [Augochlora pura]